MSHDIGHLHHVGHIVSDMIEALALYRRLGFSLPAPAYPALPPRDGSAPVPVGAANTHAEFPRNFVELVTCVREGEDSRIPSDAKIVPLQAPVEALAEIRDRIVNAGDMVAERLDRFEGLHILMFSAPDVDAVAARLRAAGVGHGGVNTVGRPIEASGGTRVEPIRFLEIDSGEPAARSATVPEGRVGVVADLDPQTQTARLTDHPNGALDLVEVISCVAGADLVETEARYQDYLGRPARADGPARVFDLDDARLVILPDSDLATFLPGERAAALPAFVAYAVAVRNIARTEELLRNNGFPLERTGSGDLFVPAASALGAAIIFRQATHGRG